MRSTFFTCLSMSRSLANQQLANVRNIGRLTGTKTFSSSVDREDKSDFYKFTLRHASSVSLGLSRLKNNADLALLSSTGAVIARSTQPDKKPEMISSALEAGTYLIRINRRKGNTRYQLRASAVAEPGAFLSSALAVGELTGSQNYADSIGGSDQVDYYKFTLSQISDFNASLNNLSLVADLNLILDANANGFIDDTDRIRTGYGYLYGDNPISETLPPGTYFVEVRTLNSSVSNYGLSLTATAKPSNLPADPGSNMATAQNVGVISGSFTAQDLVGSLDTIDYYKFSLNQISDFNATLSRLSQPVDIDLIWDANGNNFLDGNELLGSGYGSTTSNTAISKTLPPGTYFVKAERFNYINTAYDLSFSAVAKPSNIPTDPGSDLGTAYNLGLLAGNSIAQDLVGSLDKTDYYQFTMGSSGSFNATLSGLSGSVNLALIWDANGNGLIDGGERLAWGYGSTSGNMPISKTLQAGKYYIEVSSSSTVSNTAYTLTLAG